jgi:hypothetical protein
MGGHLDKLPPLVSVGTKTPASSSGSHRQFYPLSGPSRPESLATSVLRSNTFGRIIGTNLGKELAAKDAQLSS